MAMKVTEYVLDAKAKFGDRHMSDRELGMRLGGLSPSSISNARYGNMSDPIALKIAAVLGIDPGELLMVARAEREKDLTIRSHLMAYAKKALASVPSKVAAGLAVSVMALGMWLLPARDVQAAGLGGAGR